MELPEVYLQLTQTALGVLPYRVREKSGNVVKILFPPEGTPQRQFTAKSDEIVKAPIWDNSLFWVFSRATQGVRTSRFAPVSLPTPGESRVPYFSASTAERASLSVGCLN